MSVKFLYMATLNDLVVYKLYIVQSKTHTLTCSLILNSLSWIQNFQAKSSSSIKASDSPSFDVASFGNSLHDTDQNTSTPNKDQIDCIVGTKRKAGEMLQRSPSKYTSLSSFIGEDNILIMFYKLNSANALSLITSFLAINK